MFPVLVEIGELRFALGGELVVLARRPGVRLLPLVVEQSIAAHLAQQWVQRAFLRREVRLAEMFQDVRGVDFVGRDNFEDQKLEQSFPDRRELLVGAHCSS